MSVVIFFFFSSRRRHTRCALVTGVQTCALPICVFVLQIYGPPFVPLAAASTVTETLKLGTGIAIAGTRSPLETAYAAMDLDRISDGDRKSTRLNSSH